MKTVFKVNLDGIESTIEEIFADNIIIDNCTYFITIKDAKKSLIKDLEFLANDYKYKMQKMQQCMKNIKTNY